IGLRVRVRILAKPAARVPGITSARPDVRRTPERRPHPMEARPSPRSPRLLLVAAALALTAGAGCVPDVAWLPDSSGIVYTTTDWPATDRDAPPKRPNGRLVHYDLAKKKSRTIAETGTDTIQPALSPDGKRAAVAGMTWES